MERLSHGWSVIPTIWFLITGAYLTNSSHNIPMKSSKDIMTVPETKYMSSEILSSFNFETTLLTDFAIKTTTTTTTTSLHNLSQRNTKELTSADNRTLAYEHATTTMNFLYITPTMGYEENTYWPSDVTEEIIRTINPSSATKYAPTAPFSQQIPEIISTTNPSSATEYVTPSISTSILLQTNSFVFATAIATTITWEQQTKHFPITYTLTESSNQLPVLYESNERETTATPSQVIPEIISSIKPTSATEYLTHSISTSYLIQEDSSDFATAVSTIITLEQHTKQSTNITTESSTQLPEMNERETTATISQPIPEIMNPTTEYVTTSILTSYPLQKKTPVFATALSTTIILEQTKHATITQITTESSTELPETNEREKSDNSAIILELVNLTLAIDLAVSIDLRFFQELEDPSSAEYQTFVKQFKETLTFAFGTNPTFVGIRDRHFRNGSIVFSFELLLKGSIVLAEAEDEFYKNLINLKYVTVFGLQIQFNVTEMKQAYSQASEQQAAGNVCEVYRDVTYCGQGYTCRSIPGSRISCELDCTSVPVSCQSNGGTCAFDHIRNTTFCRCSVEKDVIVSGDACEIRTEQTDSLSAGEITGIVFGAIGVVGVLIAIPSALLAISQLRRT